MEPVLHAGDLVVARRQNTYHLGDIVAFRTEGGNVIHRIVGGSAEQGFITQGDNRNGSDPWRPTPKDILGKMWFRIPAGGHAVGVLRSPMVLAALAGSAAAFLVLRGSGDKRNGRRGQRGAPPG
jgi:signal peptidase